MMNLVPVLANRQASAQNVNLTLKKTTYFTPKIHHFGALSVQRNLCPRTRFFCSLVEKSALWQGTLKSKELFHVCLLLWQGCGRICLPRVS